MSDAEKKRGLKMYWEDEETKAFFRVLMRGVGASVKEAIHQVENVCSAEGAHYQLEEVQSRAGMVDVFLRTAKEEWQKEESENMVWMGWKAWNLLFYGMRQGISRGVEEGFWKLSGGQFREGAGELQELATDLLAVAKLLEGMKEGGEA